MVNVIKVQYLLVEVMKNMRHAPVDIRHLNSVESRHVQLHGIKSGSRQACACSL